MSHLTIWHWVVVTLMIVSPLMGIVRGIERNSTVHGVLSVIIPLYGLVYFFAAAMNLRSSEKASLQVIGTFPIRHAKLLAALFVLTALSTLLKGAYLSFLGGCLTLVAIWVLAGFIEPVNNLKSKIGYKALRTVIGLCGLPFAIASLTHQPVSELLQTALIAAKGYLP
jgi:hypothetical protein